MAMIIILFVLAIIFSFLIVVAAILTALKLTGHIKINKSMSCCQWTVYNMLHAGEEEVYYFTLVRQVFLNQHACFCVVVGTVGGDKAYK